MGRAKNHHFKPEELLFLYAFVKGRNRKELAEMFNAYFGLQLTFNQISRVLDVHGWTNDIDARFKPGHVPKNKGVKGMGGHEPTQFKKGHRPSNVRPVGAERVTRDGYIEVKVEEPNKWRGKHKLIWEAANGEIPEKHVVLFGDGNKQNFEPDNLILVTRSQLATLNKKGLIQDNAEATRTALQIVDVCQKIAELKRK